MLAARICLIRHFIYDLHLRREAEALADAGYLVDVICTVDKPELPSAYPGIRFFALPEGDDPEGFWTRAWSYMSFFCRAAWRVTRLHFRHRYVLIQVTSMPDFLVFATLIPRLCGAKVLAFLKEPSPELGAMLYGRGVAFLLRQVEWLVLKYAQRIITVTEQMKKLYLTRGGSPEKIEVVLNVPDERHLPAQPGEQPDLRSGSFTLLYHGTVEERYGHDLLLQAVALARDAVPVLRLRISGRGTFQPRVEEMVAELGLQDCVEIMGFLPQDEVAAVIAAADIGVVAQKSSPYANLVHTTKMYEFLMFGKPVLANCLQSVLYYFPEGVLQYYDTDCPQSMARTIAELYRRPELRASLAERGMKTYRELCWALQKQTYLSAVRAAIGG